MACSWGRNLRPLQSLPSSTGSLNGSASRGGHSYRARIESVCSAFDPVPVRQKGVESLDERRMSIKKDTYALNNPRIVNSRIKR